MSAYFLAKKYMNKIAVVFIWIISLTQVTIANAVSIEKGQTKASTCVACHGINGNSIVPSFPKLAGQNQSYLLKQLQDFKSGNRVDVLMQGIAAPLTNADMENLSVYYAAQTPVAGKMQTDKNIILGEKIYRGGKKATNVTACIACHGPKGKGIPSAGFPALASQHSAYTIKQLKEFRQDSINMQTGSTKPSRTNDFEGVMINFTKSLTNAEIEAVANYIANLR